MSYSVCSFNVRKSIRGDEKDRDFYGFLNALVRKEDIVIFAFQEAKYIYFVDNVKKNLMPFGKWEGGYVHNSELPFIWRTDRVKECSQNNAPTLVNYSSKIRLAREPVVARFVPEDFRLNIEFRFVNVHLHHGGNDLAESIEKRMFECDMAKGVIYQRVDRPAQGSSGLFNRVFTAVLGDYNLDCEECNTCGYKNIKTFQEENTTLKKEDPGYNNSYDHFSYDAVKNASVPKYQPYRIDAVNDYFYSNWTRYREQVSDHVPIKLEIH